MLEWDIATAMMLHPWTVWTYVSCQGVSFAVWSNLASRKYTYPRKYAHPPLSPKVIAKGHLLLESMPTQHDEIHIVYMYVAEVDAIGAQFGLTTWD